MFSISMLAKRPQQSWAAFTPLTELGREDDFTLAVYSRESAKPPQLTIVWSNGCPEAKLRKYRTFSVFID